MIKKITSLVIHNKNFIFVFIGLIISSTFAFANNIFLARYLDPENYGLFFSLLALIMMFGNLVVSGTPFYLQDEVSKKKFDKKKINIELNLIFFIFTILYFATLLIWVFLGPNDLKNRNILLILSPLIIFQPFIEISKTLLQIKKKYKSLSLLNLAVNLIRFVLLIFLFYVSMTALNILAVVFVIGSIIPFFISIRIFKNYFKYNLFDFFQLKKLLIRKFISLIYVIKFYLVSNILYFINISSNILIIKYLLSDYDAGIFFAAFSIILGMQLFSEATIRTFSFQYYKKSRKNFYTLKIFFIQNIKFLISIILPICLFILFFASDIIEFLYGAKYTLSSNILEKLIFIVPIRIIVTNLSCIVITFKKAYYDMITEFIIVIIKIPLMIFFIYYYGLVGVVFSLIVIETITLILMSYFVKRNIIIKKL